jgi:hypothetical protein|tara:strand:+ start:223 stop:837 length:615 start_codon:yes stop_codon:yes gene_type:complete
MASNEHKNLSNANLHAPLDFSTAANDTILTKNSSGSLEWANKNTIKADNVKFDGTSTFGSTNYFLHRDVGNNIEGKLSNDYGASTAGTITPQQALRYGRFFAYDDCNLTRWVGGITNTSPDTCYLALWRVTPVDDSNADLTVTVLKEVSVDGKGNTKIRTFDVDMTAEANNTLTKGDIIVPVVKNEDSSATLFFNSTLGLSYDN